MANNRSRWVVSIWTGGGRPAYFVSEEQRPYKLEGGLVYSQPMGVFNHDIKKAKKFRSREQAEWVASHFDGGRCQKYHPEREKNFVLIGNTGGKRL